MKSLRTLMRDRVSGGVLAAVSGWLLVLQLFVAAFTCGMTVPVGAAPQFVLCQPAASGAAAESGDDGAAFAHACPFVIGHDDDAMLAAAWALGADLGPAFARAEPVVHAAADRSARPIDPGRLGLATAPRGPPRLSA